MNNVKTQIARKGYSPTQLVNVCNVGIHVVNIVSVGWVLDNVHPSAALWAPQSPGSVCLCVCVCFLISCL